MYTPKAPRLAMLYWLVASAATLAGAGFASAADAPTDPAKPPADAASADAASADAAKAKADAAKAAAAEPIETIVITGSHIRKDVYSSASPVLVVTKEETVLAGLTTTTETLQSSAVSGGSNQINNYFGGYVTDGGPGANTLSLRGLGAVRTLVLLNGRRLAPAGTRGSVGTADLNVLPSAMVDRIEILKDGASSVYGSDAVAGVVNIITRKGIKDWTIEGTQENTFDGGGDVTKLSIVGGHAWDRFDISGSFEFDRRQELKVGQRDWASCPTQVYIDPNTGQDQGSILDPVTGKPKCFPIGDTGTNGIAHDYVRAGLYHVPDFTPVGARWTPDGAATGLLPGWREVSDLGSRPDFSPLLLNDSLISPTQNITMFVNGAYDLRALGNAELYVEGLYAHRKSEQVGTRQLSLDYQYSYDPGNPNANYIDDVPNPLVPAVFSADPNYVTYVGGNPFGDDIQARAFMIWGNDTSSQSVGFTRVVAGLRGDLTFTRDWKYDANVTVNRARAQYTFQSFLTDRIYDSTYVVEVAPGSTTAVTRTVNGKTYTCASNVGNANPTCVPAPILDAAFLAGSVDQAYRDYVWQPQTGHTNYDETTWNFTADGALFKVPAGEVRAAIGVEYRDMTLDDTPSENMINNNLYNFTSAGITRGKDNVKEIFAEVEAPLLRGMRWAEDLTLNLSGRYTDYDSYGSDETYKIGLNYTPVKWLKFRGTKGTSFRAPGIFERVLAPTSGFLAGDADPCNGYGSLNPNSTRYKNCDAEINDPNFFQFGGVQVNSAGGESYGTLQSETSDADTVGIVLQPTLGSGFGDVALAVDWWKIEVNNEVVQIGGYNLLRLCYDDPQFRAGGSYCSFSTRDPVNGSLVVDDFYRNFSSQVAEGVDYNVRYTRDISVGMLIADLRATRYLRQDSRLVSTDPIDKYNGTILAPKWVGDADLRYLWKEWTFRYGLNYVGAMDSNAYLNYGPAYDYAVDSYITHDFSIRYASLNKWSVIAGVRNFTDEIPKTISAGYYDRVGNSLLYSGYDYFGGRYFLTVSKTF